MRADLGELVESIVEKRAVAIPQKKSLTSVLQMGHRSGVRVIAEVKPVSPTDGTLMGKNTPIEKIVAAYEAGGASGISVLIEPIHFGGSIDLLKRVRETCNLPVLAKGFILSPYHLAQCAAAGADAFLQMVRVAESIDLSLREMIELGRAMEMDAVVEVVNSEEMKKALSAQARIIAVNCRNIYSDLSIDLNKVRIGQDLPDSIALISASGINSAFDLKRVYAQSGNRVDAVLVGTSLMRSDNPERAVRELVAAGNEVVARAEEGGH
ncbi:MAG: indole-3-glycerol-phosphate synthase TrpC [Candidatus Thorarchaeota archaeon]|nr:indole-3-glycerol-phosphate synthase TrpC [Candidatus Thorarchaeota archaeon]